MKARAKITSKVNHRPIHSDENLFQFDFHSKFRHGHFRSHFLLISSIESHPARPVHATTRFKDEADNEALSSDA